VKGALQRGASLKELDTVYRLPEYSQVFSEVAARQISQEVKDLVWNRDKGKCTECGSNEKLEFDHIIPFSKGGSNTYRNIQLLCEKCNRKKLNKIG
jgi:5-methylcytosine-specific restriction endonuclease McrA